jgi:hypothetical protein
MYRDQGTDIVPMALYADPRNTEAADHLWNPIVNKKTMLTRCSSLLLASLFALPSYATPVTVASNISNLVIGEQVSATGSFDINTAAGGIGLSSPYTVNSATLTFLFADNAGEYGESSWPSYMSSAFYQGADVHCNTLNCPHTYYYLDTYGTYGADPWETAIVNVGDQSATASTTVTHDQYMGATFALGGDSCGTFGCAYVPVTRPHCGSFLGTSFCDGPWPVYEQILHSYDSNGGAFSITMALNATSLLDLASDGVLNFSLGASLGNFNFLSASLLADISVGAGPGPTGPTDPTDPTNPQDPVAVPEPSSLFMMAMALFCVVGVQSRKSKSTHQSAAQPSFA